MEWENSCLRNKMDFEEEGSSTTEKLVTLRNIIEQCTEWNSALFVNYLDLLDLEKAFDSKHIEKAFGLS